MRHQWGTTLCLCFVFDGYMMKEVNSEEDADE